MMSTGFGQRMPKDVSQAVLKRKAGVHHASCWPTRKESILHFANGSRVDKELSGYGLRETGNLGVKWCGQMSGSVHVSWEVTFAKGFSKRDPPKAQRMLDMFDIIGETKRFACHCNRKQIATKVNVIDM